MMYLGKNAVGLATTIDVSSWKKKQITSTVTIDLADTMKQWIESNVPFNATYCIIQKEDMDTSSFVNNQFVHSFAINGAVFGAAIRYRDNSFQTVGTWTSAYALAISPGDVFTFYYLEGGDT